MGFDLNNYEEVKDRIPKFLKGFPDGRIITKLIENSDKNIIFVCELYKDAKKQEINCVLASGWAHEVPGSSYINKTSALENCETSAIGRALANIGLHGDKRPSREEMQKTQPQKQAPPQMDSRLEDAKNKLKMIFSEGYNYSSDQVKAYLKKHYGEISEKAIYAELAYQEENNKLRPDKNVTDFDTPLSENDIRNQQENNNE